MSPSRTKPELAKLRSAPKCVIIALLLTGVEAGIAVVLIIQAPSSDCTGASQRCTVPRSSRHVFGFRSRCGVKVTMEGEEVTSRRTTGVFSGWLPQPFYRTEEEEK